MAFVNVPIDRQSISDQESGKFVMAITHLHSYLVHPGKGVPEKERPQIRGTTIPLSGQLHLMMKRVYERSDRECKIAIAFNSSSQQNPARDLITKYADSPRLNTGRKIAQRLQEFTDGKSKMGLLFLACGQEKKKLRVLISRFPADVGILAEEEKGKLTVEFLEKVFMKNVTAYKAALYEGTSTSAGFWDGKVVDRQIVDGIVRSVSDYWVKGFLESDCRTTSAFGTKRLATLLKNCVREGRRRKDEGGTCQCSSACAQHGRANGQHRVCRPSALPVTDFSATPSRRGAIGHSL